MPETTDKAGPVWLQGGIPEPPLLGQLVRERLREAVITGEFRPGTRVKQVSLARALGVSRMPVRDAISTLVTESLLVEEPGGGIVVPILSPADVDGLLSVREVLEARALDWVLSKGGKGEPIPGEELPSVRTSPARDHVRFHRALCDAAHDRYLSTALVGIWPTLERLVTANSYFPARLTELDEDLAALLRRRQDRRARMVLSEQLAVLRTWLLAEPTTGQRTGKVS